VRHCLEKGSMVNDMGPRDEDWVASGVLGVWTLLKIVGS
jgi:hypothetical protein